MRPLTSQMLSALSANQVNPAVFVMLTLTTGPVYMWTGNTSVSWNGHTWLGVGSLLQVSVSEDVATVEARGITITLSGFDSSLLTDCLSDYATGLAVEYYLGAFDSSGSIISSPIIGWSGRTDQPTIEFDGTKATISLACESRLVDMNIAVDRRWTHNDQQRVSAGDLGFFFVDQLQEKNLYFGTSPTTSNNI